MATPESVLAIARKELGTTESPPNSNKQKYGVWYGWNGVPWCAIFVAYCFGHAGASALLPVRTASCSTMMNAAKKYGLWVTKNFKPGDVVIYDFSGKKSVAEHIGIVESVTASKVVAIEGNTSQSGSQSNGGMVCRKTRNNSLIIGAVRPRYEEDDMDFSKWTDADFVQFAVKMQAALGKQPVSAALAPELAEAKAKGITDGSNPCAFATRAQSAIMTLRESKKQ